MMTSGTYTVRDRPVALKWLPDVSAQRGHIKLTLTSQICCPKTLSGPRGAGKEKRHQSFFVISKFICFDPKMADIIADRRAAGLYVGYDVGNDIIGLSCNARNMRKTDLRSFPTKCE